MMAAAQQLDARLAAGRSSRAYRNYLAVRDHVLAMLDARDDAGEVVSVGGTPSAYWREELQNIEYLLDASPLVVERLRQHCYHVTGVWPYQYRSHKNRSEYRHNLKLEALRELGGADLFVPEPPLLGGFGFPVDGGLVNIDTLKFFEVLIALDRGAALAPFRRPERRRPVVWEIGSGWGGFAYTFKTLFPDSTYVMVDLPELFLYSATYLATAFPEATIRYWEPGLVIPEHEWLEADFVLLPNTALDDVTPPHIDLAVNMVSFQEMRADQVDRYIAHAYDRRTPLLYSLNRETGAYNPELKSVSEIVGKYYRFHQVDVLPVPYGDFPEPVPKVVKGDALKRAKSYRHLVGWRRPRPLSEGGADSLVG
jgi:hypothetical protein